MALTKSETCIFVKGSVLQSLEGLKRLQVYLTTTDDILKNTIVEGYNEKGIKSVPPTVAQQNYSMTDTAFQYFVTQKSIYGYIYVSVETLEHILDQIIVKFASLDREISTLKEHISRLEGISEL